MNVPRASYFTVLAGAALWCAAVILAPVLAATMGAPAVVGQVLYDFFHSVCHQFDERSVHLLGHPLAVCARCSAIYFGFLLSTLMYPMLRAWKPGWRPTRVLLATAVLPMMLDVAAGVAGLHEVTNTTRLVTGGLFGMVLPFIVIPAITAAVGQLLDERGMSTSVVMQKGPEHV